MKYFRFIPALLLLTSCSLAPKYTRPTAPVPSAWPTGPAYESSTAPAATDLKWQEFITDPKLQQVVSLALTNNRDLRIAALNVERAHAIYGIQRDALYPSLYATASVNNQRASRDLTQPGQPRDTERYSVNLGVAEWELDFFGRIRSLKDEALETYFATEQARRAAHLSLVSAVAQAYLALAADKQNLRLAEETLKTQQDALDLVKRRFDLGLTTELDVHRAKTLVDTARGECARYTQQVAQDENALQLLVGAPLPSHLLPNGLEQVAPPREVAAGLPSDVLLRRPDVLAAEHQLKAANADIGAARAAFFPRITLTAAIGTASSDLVALFRNGTETWSYAPQIAMPIFDARTWSAHRAAKVQREIAVTQYEKAIQTAFREVADALAERGPLRQRLAAQESLVQSLAETCRLAQSRYEKGLDSYLSVLDAQRSLFAAQQGLNLLRLAQLASRVRLYTVLGGGW